MEVKGQRAANKLHKQHSSEPMSQWSALIGTHLLMRMYVCTYVYVGMLVSTAN